MKQEAHLIPARDDTLSQELMDSLDVSAGGCNSQRLRRRDGRNAPVFAIHRR